MTKTSMVEIQGSQKETTEEEMAPLLERVADVAEYADCTEQNLHVS